MNSTASSTSVAIRNGSAPTAAALAIQPGQVTWDKFQEAALAQIGLADASNADKAVFLHQCQRTGLDPFSRQIMMIGRQERVPGTQNQWRTKWTIQTGIEGWRTIRDRAEKREGLRGILSRFTYYDLDDNERKVWTRAEPPAVVEVTYTVVERGGREVPYTSQLRYGEYVQLKDGRPIAQWATKPVHMTEKCTEADVYRRAFPQDYSGIELSDAMPEPDPSAPAVQAQPQRATAEQIRLRRPAVQATAEPVTDPSPAAESAPPVAEPAGEAHEPPKASPGQVGKIRERFEYFGYTDDDKAARLRDTAKLAGCKGELTSTKNLTADQAASVLRQVQNLTDAQALMDLVHGIEVPGGE